MDNEEQTGAVGQQQETGATSEQGTEGGDNGQSGQREEGKDYFPAFQDQQRRAVNAETKANGYKQQLIDAGILDKDGKPKQKQASSEQGSASSSTGNSEDVTRARLEARGILDEDEQDEVMRAAKLLGITPVKALDDDIVKGKLKAMRDQKATKEATPAPGSRGGGTSTDNIGRLADKAFETGELPRDPALRQKVREEMKRRK
jgi:hypothetical protein